MGDFSIMGIGPNRRWEGREYQRFANARIKSNILTEKGADLAGIYQLKIYRRRNRQFQGFHKKMNGKR